MSFGDDMNIYIIGMPLSGKTTTANKLNKLLNYQVIDLDNYIEETYNVNINNLFDSGNEQTFRDLETKALKEIKKLNNYIISTGGGIVLKESNKSLMDGPAILLDVSLEELNKRQAGSYTRPLLKDNKLADLYKVRKNMYYKFADIIIKSNDLDEVVNEIISKLKEEGYL